MTKKVIKQLRVYPRWLTKAFAALSLKKKMVLTGNLILIVFNIIKLSHISSMPFLTYLTTCNITVWVLNMFIAVYARDINLPYKIMTIYGLITTITHCFLMGGMYSSYMFWLPVISLGMSIFLNRFYAILTMVFSVLAYSLFLYLQLTGIVDFQADIQKVPPLLDYANFVCVMVMLSAIHYFFFTRENLNLLWKKKSEWKMGYLQTQLSEKELQNQKMRNNMAKDFHDEMGNKLASISMLSNSLKLQLQNKLSDADGETIRMLGVIEKTASEVFEGTKDFIWAVDFKSDYIFELFLYLREFGERFFNNLDINFRSDYKLDESLPYKLGPLVGRQLILICKEVMTNAARHSKCSDFVFVMELDKDELKISLLDNGQGFDVGEVKKRGLNNISSRCKMVGARCDIQSKQGAGTEFYIYLGPILKDSHLLIS